MFARGLCPSTDAVTDIEGTNSFTFNFAANTGPSFSPPFQPVEPHYVPGANEGPINAGQANTFTWPAFPPHGTPAILVLISAIALTTPSFVSSGGWFALPPRAFLWG